MKETQQKLRLHFVKIHKINMASLKVILFLKENRVDILYFFFFSKEKLENKSRLWFFFGNNLLIMIRKLLTHRIHHDIPKLKL